jgi:monovalent cation/hydrogen antiporter
MQEIELVLALLVAVAALSPVARALRIPQPILLVLVGLLLALAPPVPEVQLDPELVFFLFLPPLLYIAGFDTSIREVRALLRPILSLAVGLVLATTAAVAVLAHAVLPDLDWPTAFALGAMVSPPDAVAAVAIFRGLGVPRRMVTLLESESLFNHATALVTYQAALGVSATAAVSAGGVGLRFLVVGIGGVLVGLVVARAIVWLRQRLHDSSVEITVSLLTPFAAYLPAEWLGVSGVLATVTTGLSVGWAAPSILESDTRLRGRAVWEMVVFVLNGLVFILIGLQLSSILAGLESRALLSAVGIGILISLVVIVVRLAWVFAYAFVPHWLDRRRRGHKAAPRWQEIFIVGWAGMRGVVSLATALALPLETPARDLLLFVTFCVILVTLVGQGFTLPGLVRLLGAVEDDTETQQERRARAVAAEAALARIEQLPAEWPTHLPFVDTLRAQYADRVRHFEEPEPGQATEDGRTDDGVAQQEFLAHRRMRRAVIDAERAAVLVLRERGEIDDKVWRGIERDLDLEELRLDA